MKARAIVALIALAALVACACQGRDAWAAWLPPLLFVAGTGVGLLALGWVHALTGGAWGELVRLPARGASMMVGMSVVAWLPLAWRAPDVLDWMHGGVPHAQRWFLSPLPFFIRSFACLAVLALFAWQGATRPLSARRGVLSLLAYAVVVTLMAVDWIMALVPAWHSAVLGMTLASSQMLSGLALAMLCAAGTRDLSDKALLLRDLANLLLALTLLWGYLAFMDYLTAWMGDLPSETVWYLPRVTTGWRWLGVVMVVLGFVLPLASLLSRQLKDHRRALAFVAASALAGQACFIAWLVLPSLRAKGAHLGIVDVLAWAGMLSLAWAGFGGAWSGRTAREGERA